MEDVNGQLMFAPRQKVKASRFDFDIDRAHRLPNGDWVQADVDEFLIAEPRWIVEYKLHDREKDFHEAVRYDSERDRHVEWREVYDTKKGKFVMKEFVYDYENPHARVDALGPYPEDGKWARLFVVAQHWVQCCEEANAGHYLCQGVGRAPNDNDLQDIRKILQEREAEPVLPEPGTTAWDYRIKEETRKVMNVLAENAAHQKAVYDEIFDRAILPTLKRVYRRNNPAKSPTVGIHIPDNHPLLKGESE